MSPRVYVTPDGSIFLVSSRGRIYEYRETETGMLCGRRVHEFPSRAREVTWDGLGKVDHG